MRILIADDYASSRLTVRIALEAAYPGAEITEAPDGQYALEAVQAAVPDLIVTDYDMPRLDGFGLAERLRQAGRTCGIPVVLVSAQDDAAMRARAIRYAVALAPKPIAVPAGGRPFADRLLDAIHAAEAIVAPLRRAS